MNQCNNVWAFDAHRSTYLTASVYLMVATLQNPVQNSKHLLLTKTNKGNFDSKLFFDASYSGNTRVHFSQSKFSHSWNILFAKIWLSLGSIDPSDWFETSISFFRWSLKAYCFMRRNTTSNISDLEYLVRSSKEVLKW